MQMLSHKLIYIKATFIYIFILIPADKYNSQRSSNKLLFEVVNGFYITTKEENLDLRMGRRQMEERNQWK